MPKKPTKAKMQPVTPSVDLETLLRDAAFLNLQRFGTALGSKEFQRMLRIEMGTKRCTHCGKTKSIKGNFGTKTVRRRNGTTYLAPQGWCIACRGRPEAHLDRIR